MSRKIIISESQYKRVFLKEENSHEPLKPNIKSVQTFLNNKGITDYEGKKLKYDGYGNRTASAFAKYHFGFGTKVKDTKSLWMKLKLQGYDVGGSYGNTDKMVIVMTDIINYKESPTTGVQDFLNDLIGTKDDPNNDGLGISFENLKKYGDRLIKYTTTKLHDWDEGLDNKLYDKYITSKEEGNKFRNWVHENTNILNKINKTLKEIGFSDGFSKSGNHDNIYFLIAWDVAGTDYLGDTVKEYMGDDLWYQKLLNDFSKELNQEFKQKVENFKQTYKTTDSYKIYSNALSNWNKVNNEFGWKQPNTWTLDDETFEQLQDMAPKSSVCFNPSWVLIKKFVAETKLILMNPNKNRALLSDIDKNTDLGNITDFKKMVDKISSGWSSNYPLLDSPFIQPTSGLPSLDFLRNREEARKNTYSKLASLGDEEIKLLVVRNNFNEILKFMDQHNKLISVQSAEDLKRIKYGDRIVFLDSKKVSNPWLQENINLLNKDVEDILVLEQSVVGAPNYGMSSESVKTYEIIGFNMKQACKNYGGVFLYSDGTPEGKKNPSVCCSNQTFDENTKVNISGQVWESNTSGAIANIPTNKKSTVSINLMDSCEAENVQPWGEWFGDKAKNCVNDWHCLADIASIVLSFFGPVGIIAAAAIDSISALGYYAEEGWEEGKWDIILTGIGAIPGLGELKNISKLGPKVSKTMFEIGKAIEGLDKIEAAVEIEKIVSKLSKSEREQIDVILKAFESIKGKEKLIKEGIPSMAEINKLSSWEKDIIEKMTKEMSPAEFIIKYKNAGYDLSKMASTSKKIKSVVSGGNLLQISLFAGMYLGSDQIGKLLVSLHEDAGIDPFGLFDDNEDKKETKKEKTPLEQSIENIYLLTQKEKTKLTPKEKEVYDEVDSYLNINPEKITPQVKKIAKIITECQDKLFYIEDKFTTNANIQDYKKSILGYVMQLGNNRGVGDDVYGYLNNVKESLYKITDNSTENEVETILKDLYNELTGFKLPPELTDEQKQIQLFIGDPNKKDTTDMKKIIELGQKLENVETPIKEHNVIIENNYEIILNEEIKRIKSLFTNERLYGNLVNEVCDDENEAIDFLSGKGYLVSKTTKHDVCIGENTALGKVYRYLTDSNSPYDLSKFNVKPENDSGQCMLKFRNKSFGSVSGQLVMFTLFFDEDGSTKQWNAYYQLANDKSDICAVKMGPSGFEYNFYIGTRSEEPESGVKLADKTYYGGGVWVKFGGDWTYNETNKKITEVNLVNGNLLGVIDKSGVDKVGKIDFNIPMTSAHIEIDLGVTSTLDTMKGGGGCGTISEVLEEKLGFDVTSNGLVCEIKTMLNKVK